ncbi:lantibiotic dehydratase [Glycomyces harbinensis]|uniref:Thiopeptide-type bacteriocin biosynthesis domain-containing protein n=1 Tax=Glycomyces harbinensis TaxID=58114 RepID=A0A1G6WUS6_9ACTN|nr:lantibiotic dehydratase [Glycomyces harbinensis]SDD68947.1 thiopeptide-type bacteriocin biosynthesis domain-containing protein [Glycomyces harbinensis]
MDAAAEPARRIAYTAGEFFMLRAPLLPVDVFTRLTTDAPGVRPDSLEERRAAGRERLWELVDRPRVAHALHVASADLTERLRRLDGPPAGRAADRTFATLLRYLTRMSTRSTPFGLCAAVAMGRFAPATTAALRADPMLRARTRADYGWIADVAARIGSDPALREDLPVRANELRHHTSGLVILQHVDGGSVRRVALQATAPVATALHLADGRITFAGLVSELERRYPGAGRDRVRALLTRMWEQHVLIADLSAPMSPAPPELDLAERLAGVRAPVVAGLRRSRELADAVDAAGGRASPSLLDRYTEHQRRMSPDSGRAVYQTDTALATTGTALSDRIATAAADAGALIMRLNCMSPRLPHIAEYHSTFVERYGLGAEIALLDVLSPERGLGPPNGYASPPRAVPLPTQPATTHLRRDRAVVDLVATAVHHRVREVELTDADLEALTVWPDDTVRTGRMATLDVYAKIAAPSREAIDEGRFRLVLAPGSFQGLQSFGRFADLFDEDALAAVRAFARAEEAPHPDVVFAELNTAPWLARQGNLIARPVVREWEVCVNAAPVLPADRRIALPDILVGATGSEFYLRSRRNGKRLVVTRSHAVTNVQAPNAVRALLELSADMFAIPSPFNWGPMSQAPFLPRLVRGNIVLSPAYWTVDASTFGDAPTGDPDRGYDLVQRWRRDWEVPRHVYLTAADHRLLLDLEHPMCVDELLREVRKGASRASASVFLYEMLPDFSELWLRDEHGRGYQSEVVVPLLPASAGVDHTHAPSASPGTAAAVARHFPPGGEWAFVKLYTAVAQQDDVLTGPLQALLADLHEHDLIDGWFFVRYADPQPHLRLRFHAADTDAAPTLLSKCAAWAADQVRAGWASDVALAGYARELERYGGPDAIAAMERVFQAGSETTVRLLAAEAEHGLDQDMVCVSALHALCRSWGSDPLVLAAEKPGRSVSESVRRRFRALRPLLCELLAPGQPGSAPAAPRYAAVLDPVFARQHDALAEAGALARKLARDARLSCTEGALVESLLHMQANRLTGIDRDRERECRELWALAARAIANRPAGRPAT